MAGFTAPPPCHAPPVGSVPAEAGCGHTAQRLACVLPRRVGRKQALGAVRPAAACVLRGGDKGSKSTSTELVHESTLSIAHEAEIGEMWGCQHAAHCWWLLGWHRGTKDLVPCRPRCPTSHPGDLRTKGVLLVQEQPPNPVPSPSPPATEQPPGAGHHRCHRGALLEPSQVWKAPSDFPLPGSGERLRRVPAEGLCYLQLLAARLGRTANGAVSVAAPLTPVSPQMCPESCACALCAPSGLHPKTSFFWGGEEVWGC